MKYSGAFAALGALVLSGSFGATAPGVAAPEATPRASPAASTPCGFVEFVPVGPPRFVEGTARETIKASVSFPDGHRETAVFPYSWVYPNGEKTDPWSDTNLRNPNFAVPLQLPPAGADVKAYSPLIRYVLAHTSADGVTDLRECGNAKGELPPAPAYDAAAQHALAMASVLGWAAIIDDSPADSPVRIVSAALFAPRDPGSTATIAHDCVTFWNRSSKSVGLIRFTFTHFDAAGELKLIQPFDRHGSIAPGVVVEGPRQPKRISFADPEALRNCIPFVWSWKAGVNRVVIASIYFDDGSTWRPRTPAPPPAPRR